MAVGHAGGWEELKDSFPSFGGMAGGEPFVDHGTIFLFFVWTVLLPTPAWEGGGIAKREARGIYCIAQDCTAVTQETMNEVSQAPPFTLRYNL